MECTVEQSDEKEVLTLEGELTIINAAELKRVLQETIEHAAREVELNIEKVTDIDLSCLQLFCSAHRTSVKLEKSITIRSSRPQIFKDTIREAGFPRKEGCKLDPDKSCLWIEGP